MLRASCLRDSIILNWPPPVSESSRVASRSSEADEHDEAGTGASTRTPGSRRELYTRRADCIFHIVRIVARSKAQAE